jgi:hypothetical protein
LLAVIIIFFVYINFPVKENLKKAQLGVTYSAMYAESIGLDKKEVLMSILDDLEIKKVRIPVYWNLIEPEKDQYDFSEIDWQLEELENRNAEVILVIGQKVPRWPECFVPEWIGNDEAKRIQELLEYIEVVTDKYKGRNVIKYWQVENEPFLPFGICPEFDSKILDQEIATVRLIDPNRKIIVTDSGELSLWIQSAKRADIFGTTLYRSVHSDQLNLSFDYPIGPNFFKFKKWLAKRFAGQEDIIVVELQGEPWLTGWTVDFPLEEQLESMDEEKLRDNVEFTKKAGFNEIYLWGVEWWYWLKINKDHPALWDEAAKIVNENSN